MVKTNNFPCNTKNNQHCTKQIGSTTNHTSASGITMDKSSSKGKSNSPTAFQYYSQKKAPPIPDNGTIWNLGCIYNKLLHELQVCWKSVSRPNILFPVVQQEMNIHNHFAVIQPDIYCLNACSINHKCIMYMTRREQNRNLQNSSLETKQIFWDATQAMNLGY